MRITFLEDVPVKFSDVPKTAVGALGILRANPKPVFSTTDGVTAKVEFEQSAPDTHFYRKGWHAEVPNEIGQRMLDDGLATLCARTVTFTGDVDVEPSRSIQQ